MADAPARTRGGPIPVVSPIRWLGPAGCMRPVRRRSRYGGARIGWAGTAGSAAGFVTRRRNSRTVRTMNAARTAPGNRTVKATATDMRLGAATTSPSLVRRSYSPVRDQRCAVEDEPIHWLISSSFARVRLVRFVARLRQLRAGNTRRARARGLPPLVDFGLLRQVSSTWAEQALRGGARVAAPPYPVPNEDRSLQCPSARWRWFACRRSRAPGGGLVMGRRRQRLDQPRAEVLYRTASACSSPRRRADLCWLVLLVARTRG